MGNAEEMTEDMGGKEGQTGQAGFVLAALMTPAGDQPRAVAELCALLESGSRDQVLLGVTGSGKTFTMAQVVARLQRPTLVMAPNKTLAAQLFAEFKDFFPNNAVEYFVSYYDYYQPEAYIPQSDTYIEKDSSINEAIDTMRHSATRSLLTRRDVLVVASVSCIYGLGSPEEYRAQHLFLRRGQDSDLEELKRRLVAMLYERNDVSFHRGSFRARGDVLEVFPAYEEDRALRIGFFGDTVESIACIDPLTGRVLQEQEEVLVFAGSHYVSSRERLAKAIAGIQEELRERLAFLGQKGQVLEAQRLEQRTMFDLEMMAELGYCTGIENYSRHLTGRAVGEPPPTLLDFFPDDMLLFIDESHIGVPQIGGMYHGDFSRKKTLVEYGFRLPSALDNRPLRFAEFRAASGQTVFVSATPGEFELGQAAGKVVEQLVRPTGLLDPLIELRPATGQVDDLLGEIRKRQEKGEAVLVTTLTKRMSEDLSNYLCEVGVQVRYLHSDIKTLERMELIRGLRAGEFQVLVGINLLREGLDMPEVSLVAVLDADKEGFLRSARSLIQTCGRAARNVHGRVILYADRVTDAMRQTMEETGRRRVLQQEYNERNGIVPQTVTSRIKDVMETVAGVSRRLGMAPQAAESPGRYREKREFASVEDLRQTMKIMERQMEQAAVELRFEAAAALRDQIRELRKLEMMTA